MTSYNQKNRTTAGNQSCMHCHTLEDAINARHPGCVRRMLEQGADPNGWVAWRKRVLHLCLDEHCPEITRLLLRYGADPYWYYEDYSILDPSFVESAVAHQDFDSLAACIAELPEGVDSRNPADGETLLHVATRQDMEKVCEYLIHHGADPLLRNKKGESALDLAKDGSPVFHLLQHRARVLGEQQAEAGEKLRELPGQGRSGGALPPIFAAIEAGDEALVERMLRQGEQAGRSTPTQDTLLHHAARLGRTGCVRLLIRYGAQVNRRNFIDETPLYLAACEDHPGTVRALLQAGADTETFTEGLEDTPLMACRYHKTTSTAQELLQGGADPLTKDSYGFTALDCARESGNKELLQLLESYTNKNRFLHDQSR